MAFILINPYSKLICFTERHRGSLFKDIKLWIQNVQLETHLFTLSGASFFSLTIWNLFKLFLLEISLVFVNMSCLQVCRMCECELVPILHFPFLPAHSYLFVVLLILLHLVRLIPCMGMYSTHRIAPGGILTPWFIFSWFLCLISTKQYYSMMEVFELAQEKQKSQRYKYQLRN